MQKRRDFLKRLVASSVAAAGTNAVLTGDAQLMQLLDQKRFGPNDTVRIGSIGMGIIGFANVNTALQIPGVELVAAADCYTSRLEQTRAQFGEQVETTRDYREILRRNDIDAVLINTPDHWHMKMSIDALEAGKHVRCEKPMVQKIEQGMPVIEASSKSDKVFQVGSQGISSVSTLKARTLLEEGAIGELNMIEGVVSRNSALGAWQYSIPAGASEENIDWEGFQGEAPKRAFDADRFFRWRKYWDYGTGVAGDMFVHRFTTLHHVVNTLGPERAFAMGGVRYWNDGREAPDVQVCLYDYAPSTTHPAFTLVLKSNLADGGGGGPMFTIIGSEGALVMRGETVTVMRAATSQPSVQQLVQGYNSVRTFAPAQQEAFADEYTAYAKAEDITMNDMRVEASYSAPSGYDASLVHMLKFINAIRNGGPIIEDAAYGLRAAAPSLMANMSYVSREQVRWNPRAMQLIG